MSSGPGAAAGEGVAAADPRHCHQDVFLAGAPPSAPDAAGAADPVATVAAAIGDCGGGETTVRGEEGHHGFDAGRRSLWLAGTGAPCPGLS